MTQTIEEAESSYYSDKQKGDYVLGKFFLFSDFLTDPNSS